MDFTLNLIKDVTSNRSLYKFSQLPNFPFTNFEALKNDVLKKKATIISVYNYNFMKAIDEKNQSRFHSLLLIIPTLSIILNIVFAIIYKDWIFLLSIPITLLLFNFSSKYSNSLIFKFCPLILVLATLISLYFQSSNWFLLCFSMLIVFFSIVLARKQYNNIITSYSIQSEEHFCYLMIKDIISLKSNGQHYIYKAYQAAGDLLNKWKQEGKL